MLLAKKRGEDRCEKTCCHCRFVIVPVRDRVECNTYSDFRWIELVDVVVDILNFSKTYLNEVPTCFEIRNYMSSLESRLYLYILLTNVLCKQ